jgi:hypothetical protein
MVYLGGMRPFNRPLIVGSELVSFSAIMTARHARIQPVAMIEQGDRIVARRPADLLAKALWGVPVLTRTRLLRILGVDRVEGVELERGGALSSLSCDGVIFTGRFLPEAALVQASHLALDKCTGGPMIDSAWRCSDPAYFAAGNILRPVEHSGWAAAEGRSAAHAIVRALAGRLSHRERAVPVRADGNLRYVYPQYLLPDESRSALFARAARAHRGRLRVLADGQEVSSRRVNSLPERRLVIDLPNKALRGAQVITVTLD